ncbi:hypothetical protein TVAG_420480 [Trichomonas vaginalis G3]|uniref:Peptidase C14 caspase domain-containing protein n=1 Tax=Trichomonas vaginalis (strain ATCC PRA-98 / G3) TaxID=412133 RepID=A2ED71_TRIV3|nr:cysteine-type peptidase protein [Trichomonas vaginalis G3]EAY09426.1 hypothetical protein TVAG_420480 [Trichomonas vaginalis G3]KAI5536347.1 cysteine-type peptidase protein [Trichomonas vaginalis G3]|eukprot:XP_001321649.1 hypothetical protein [Trichomonas vaginalis G3]
MGNILSCFKGNQIVTLLARVLMSKLGMNFSLDEWNNARLEGDVQTHLENAKTLGTDLSKASKSSISNLDKAVFICINTYVSEQITLGVGPMNDGINVAEAMAAKKWPIFFLHNPTQAQYLEWLDVFLANTKSELITYYTGHGTQVDGGDGQENDSKNEAYVFENGSQVECTPDDTLQKHLVQYKTNANLKVILLSDCCHSGTIWDLNKSDSPQNCISISAAQDKQTAKQTQVESKEQGIFTYYLMKFLEQNPTATPNWLGEQMLPYLTKFQQNFTVQTSTQSLLDSSLL